MKELDFGKDKISSIILRIAPPVMLATLIQALYNIVDSLFVGKYLETGLTALSIVYPVQLLMIAVAVGTGVGINTSMSYKLGVKDEKGADKVAGIGTALAIILYLLFGLGSFFFMPYYASISTQNIKIREQVVEYGSICSIFSLGLFLESIYSKVLQARGKMKQPMIAQILGAITNIVLDPLLIFGYIGFPSLGIKGAAIATVVGQFVAMFVVVFGGFKKSPNIKEYPKEILTIYKLGLPNIIMQAAYTFYIFGLNMILAKFSDQAVTALGLYYKWQTFFFIPLGALQTCIVPLIGYNYASKNYARCKKSLNTSLLYGVLLMLIGVICFEAIPSYMLSVFTNDQEVIDIGTYGFRIIGISFIPMTTSLIYPVFFQALSKPVKSSFLTFLRTLILFVPLGYLLSLISLEAFWFTFPLTELITSLVGFIFYLQFSRKELKENKENSSN